MAVPPPERSPLDASFTRRWLAPALLLATTPFIVVAVWMINFHFDGSVLRFVREIDARRFFELFPRPTLAAARILVFWSVFQGALLALLPGRTHVGPVTPAGNQPRYRLNGVAAWAVTHAGLFAAWRLGWWSPSAVVRELGAMLVLLCAGALALCVLLYWKGRRAPSTTDAVYTGHVLFDFFQGVELHPAIAGVNLKQLINCRISMMGWSALVLCLAGGQLEATGSLSNAMAVSTFLLVAYLFKFFVWEEGYFNSLDIMHDRFGYYICWGVLVWVPGVYTVFAQYLALHPTTLHPALAAAIAALGLASLWMNFAADEQRRRVRATGGRSTVWGRPPRTLRARYRAADGVERENLLLVSGYWGLARHFHYVPELAMALAWALPAGRTAFLPYFYFAFLTILLVDRANRDDRRCQAKYGLAWDEYRRLVRWKILPGVY
jgi:7-dehydrocholesterol reductase